MDCSELNRLYDFSGQTIVITGGTGILGSEIASALVGCGANVAILDRYLDPAKHILELMGLRTNHALAVRAGVLDRESLRKAAEIIQEKFGAVQGLINAAGGNKPQATTSPDFSFFDLPADALRWVFD
jgi:NAD(P)-dependent dehydrogenase (short-subunit alcohol dehydrogenase family)